MSTMKHPYDPKNIYKPNNPDIFLDFINSPKDYIECDKISALLADRFKEDSIKKRLETFSAGSISLETATKAKEVLTRLNVTASASTTNSFPFNINNFEVLISQALAHFEKCFSYQEKAVKLKSEYTHLLDALLTRRKISRLQLDNKIQINDTLLYKSNLEKNFIKESNDSIKNLRSTLHEACDDMSRHGLSDDSHQSIRVISY